MSRTWEHELTVSEWGRLCSSAKDRDTIRVAPHVPQRVARFLAPASPLLCSAMNNGAQGLIRATAILRAEGQSLRKVYVADVSQRIEEVALGVEPTWRVLFSRLPPQRCLVVGETGSGKEHVAEVLGYSLAAWRLERPELAVVNVAAITESLLEAELFGIKNKIASGVGARDGRFLSVSAGGTVVLDELDKAPLRVQTALLRVLENNEVTPVGSSTPIKHEVHVIATTNRTLAELRGGAILPDLYQRLAREVIQLKPLREASLSSSIVFLSEEILKRLEPYETSSPEIGGAVSDWRFAAASFATDIIAPTMRGYNWPGNLRELAGLLQAVIQLGGSEEAAREKCRSWRYDGMPEVSDAVSVSLPTDLRAHLRKLESQLVKQAMDVHGTQARAARALGVDQSHVSRVMTRAGQKVDTPSTQRA